MKLSKIFFIISILLLVTFIKSGICDDNSRRGFVLGGGAGFGLYSQSGTDGQSKNYYGFQTDLNIGHGINEQLIIHYSGKQFWGLGSKDYTFFTQGNPHVALTYFFKPDAPSFFVGAGFGPALIFQVGNDYANLAGKGSAHFTFGREIKRNLLVEFTAIRSFAGHDYVNDSWNIILLLNWLKY